MFTKNDLTVLTRHANASESSPFIDASSFILAGIRLALVDVDLASSTSETGRTIAAIRTRSVDANATVLTWRT